MPLKTLEQPLQQVHHDSPNKIIGLILLMNAVEAVVASEVEAVDLTSLLWTILLLQQSGSLLAAIIPASSWQHP